jgi:hypothetical protein
MKSDQANECSFCGASETDGACLWNDEKRARDSKIFICQDCVWLAATAGSEVVSPRSIFSFDGHELQWLALKGLEPVLSICVSRVDSNEGCWLPFGYEEQPTEEMAREVATKMRHHLKLDRP